MWIYRTNRAFTNHTAPNHASCPGASPRCSVPLRVICPCPGHAREVALAFVYTGVDALQLAMMTQMVTHVVLWEGSMWLLTLQSHI
jgi:hypothetical protein